MISRSLGPLFVKSSGPLLLAAAALGCGPGTPPPGDVPPHPVPAAAPCTITGSGEVASSGFDGGGIDLYETQAGGDPILRIAAPGAVALTWSELPQASSPPGRARVETGGQHLVRLHAYAPLRGRAFELKRRATSEADHLWVQGGAVVQVAGLRGSKVEVVYPTPFLSEPKTVVALAACEDLAYETKDLPPMEEAAKLVSPAGSYVVMKQGRLALARAPREEPFFHAVFGGTKVLALLETKDGWAHVSTVAFELGLDGWIHEGDADPIREPPTIGGHGATGGSSAPRPTGTAVTVTTESPLFVGRPGRVRAVDGAAFEAGAKLHQHRTDGPLAEVELDGGEIVAASAEDALWIAKADVR